MILFRLVFAAMALALAACAGQALPASGDGAAGVGGAPVPCQLGGMGPATPVVNAGPDVSFDLACGGVASAPIASISILGDRPLSWRVSLDGPPTVFRTKPEAGTICSTGGVTIVTATVTLPGEAMPGATFDATFTFSADHGEFPDAAVKVRARVVSPEFTIEPAEIDFGEVPPGASPRRMVTFTNKTDSFLRLEQLQTQPPFMSLWDGNGPGPRGSLTFPIVLGSAPVGDYAREEIWRASARPSTMDLTMRCPVTKTLKLHARVVETTAGDAGADESID